MHVALGFLGISLVCFFVTDNNSKWISLVELVSKSVIQFSFFRTFFYDGPCFCCCCWHLYGIKFCIYTSERKTTTVYAISKKKPEKLSYELCFRLRLHCWIYWQFAVNFDQFFSSNFIFMNLSNEHLLTIDTNR